MDIATIATISTLGSLAANLSVINLGLVLLISRIIQKKRNKYRKSVWVRKIFQRRKQRGYYNNVVQEMRKSDDESHFRFFRMTASQFDYLLSLIEARITKKDTRFRKAISAAERLAITLRYLASTDMQLSVAFAFRVGPATVSKIVRETCYAIWEFLAPKYLIFPKTKEEWKNISAGFQGMWNLPHCLGAVDGKHVVIESPSNSGSKYYNYKGAFSINLMAMCDSHYRFTMVDIGSYGSQSDGGVFSESTFGSKLLNQKLEIPDEEPLPGTSDNFPYFCVGDEAFPLHRNLMRPYPGRNNPHEKKIYNYRLSRARRVIENTFGILCSRWRIFRRPIRAKPANVDSYVRACVCLHNFLMTDDMGKPRFQRNYNAPSTGDQVRQDGKIIDGKWRSQITSSCAIRGGCGIKSGNNHSKKAAELRNRLALYLCNEGAVGWQNEYVNRGKLPEE